MDEERGLVLAEGRRGGVVGVRGAGADAPRSRTVLLREFWKLVREAGTIVTFNGRGFDGPYLMIRSAILGVEPSRNFVPYR